MYDQELSLYSFLKYSRLKSNAHIRKRLQKYFTQLYCIATRTFHMRYFDQNFTHFQCHNAFKKMQSRFFPM